LAVVDLDKVAKELGRDVKIKKALKNKEAELNKQLSTLQASLNAEYENRKLGIGGFASEADLRSLRNQIAVRLNRAQRQARTDLVRYKQKLVREFREEVKPVAREVAAARGLSIVIPKNDGIVLTFEPSVDITDTVAEKLRENSPKVEQISDAGSNQKH